MQQVDPDRLFANSGKKRYSVGKQVKQSIALADNLPEIVTGKKDKEPGQDGEVVTGKESRIGKAKDGHRFEVIKPLRQKELKSC